MSEQIDTLNYWQGYFDCFKNISSSYYSLERLGSDPSGFKNVLSDARGWELRMYEKLKEKHGDKFQVDRHGRGTIKT